MHRYVTPFNPPLTRITISYHDINCPVTVASPQPAVPEKSKEKLSRRIAKSLGIRSSSSSANTE